MPRPASFQPAGGEKIFVKFRFFLLHSPKHRSDYAEYPWTGELSDLSAGVTPGACVSRPP